MGRSRGADAVLALGYEGTYGTPPAANNYNKLPFVSTSLGAEQGLIESDLIGQGRDPLEPARDVITDDGDVVIPVDVRNIGYWLKLLFGAATVTGAGPFTHTFLSGATTLPSAAIEVGHPNVPAFFMNAGLVASSIGFDFQTSGLANATVNLIGQSETNNGTTQVGTLNIETFKRFNQFQGSIKKDSTTLGNISAAQLTYDNNLEAIRVIRSDGLVEGVDPSVASLSGNIEAFFDSTDLYDDAVANTPVELEFAYTIDANNSLVITVHRARLPQVKRPIDGPGSVQASFAFQAEKDDVAGQMVTVALTNDVASY